MNKGALALVSVLVIYTVIAVLVGNRVLSYRSDWLDSPGLPNRTVKFVLSLITGYVVACFYLGWKFFKLAMTAFSGK